MADSAPRWPIVLMYHAVGRRAPDVDIDNLFVPVDAFAAQLDVVAARGLQPIALDAVDGAGPGTVLLTFDDAYVSTLDSAAPLLAARGWPAVVFVASRTLGALSAWNAHLHEPLLDAAGVRALVDAGFAVGAHSRTHADLRGLPAAELDDEVSGSRGDLADLLGRPPRWFAYPFGWHDAASRQSVAAAGFTGAFAVHDGGGRFAWPRRDVNATDTLRTFGLKLRPSYPVARRLLGVAPPVRRFAHRLAGYANRG